ncbi:MAG: hypothetical protein JNJ71_05095 [Rubrivivax sp.]|nr:hypothetical protein [Rubrivivax sp.]
MDRFVFGLRTAGLLAACALALSARAQGVTIECPMRVMPLSAAVADASMPGFKLAFLPTSLAYLLSVSVLDGPGAEARELPPGGSATSPQWPLEGQTRAVLSCRYEGGIQLLRTLRAGTRQCSAVLKRSQAPGADGYGLDQVTVVCQ